MAVKAVGASDAIDGNDCFTGFRGVSPFWTGCKMTLVPVRTLAFLEDVPMGILRCHV